MRPKAVRALVAIVAALALSGTTVFPAAGAPKDKKKKPEPFVTEGSIMLPGPLIPVTEAEFLFNCPEIPTTQGVDAFVVEIPPEFALGDALASIEGTGAAEPADWSQSYYDAGCGFTDTVSGATSFVPPGTRYIVVFAAVGADIAFELEVAIQ